MIPRMAPAILLLLGLLVPGAAAQQAGAPPAFPPAATHDAPAEIDTTGAPFLGSANAPVTIVEFLDFRCPYCIRATPLLRELVATNPDKVRLVVMAFPLPAHEHAFLAAETAREAQRQGKFWEVHDGLLAAETDLDPDRIRSIAAEAGLDMKALDAAIKARTHRNAVAQEQYRGRRLGVESTPTIYVNGYKVGPRRDLPAMQELIDDLAAGRTPRQLPPPPPPVAALDTIRGGDPVRGNPAAPVTLVEYADFHCPYCRQTQPLIRQVLNLYPEQVRVVYKNFPVPRQGGNGLLAAQAALAAHAQGKFWEMHDRLFASSPAIDAAGLIELAGELGLDTARFEEDMASPDILKAIRNDVAMGRRAQVDKTPTLFVNNLMVPRRDIRLIRAMIEGEIRAAGQEPVTRRLEREGR